MGVPDILDLWNDNLTPGHPEWVFALILRPSGYQVVPWFLSVLHGQLSHFPCLKCFEYVARILPVSKYSISWISSGSINPTPWHVPSHYTVLGVYVVVCSTCPWFLWFRIRESDFLADWVKWSLSLSHPYHSNKRRRSDSLSGLIRAEKHLRHFS